MNDHIVTNRFDPTRPPLPRLFPNPPRATTTAPIEPSPLAPTPADPADAALLWLDRAHAAWAAGSYDAATSAAKIADVWQYRSERHGVQEIPGVTEFVSRGCTDELHVAIAAITDRMNAAANLTPASYGTPVGECSGGYRCTCEDASSVGETQPLPAVPAPREDDGPAGRTLSGVPVPATAVVVDLPEMERHHGDLIEHDTAAATS